MGAEPDLSTDLCTSCGLCCNGKLFNFAEVTPEEEPALAAEGFTLCNDHGARGFSQPCHKLVDCRCTCYEARPAACRAFRCDLLRAVEQGRVAPEDAHGVVAKVLDQTAILDTMLPLGETMVSFSARRAAGEAVDPALALQVGVVNLLLSRHFHKRPATPPIARSPIVPPPLG